MYKSSCPLNVFMVSDGWGMEHGWGRLAMSSLLWLKYLKGRPRNEWRIILKWMLRDCVDWIHLSQCKGLC
jgi:hypothetical protein